MKKNLIVFAMLVVSFIKGYAESAGEPEIEVTGSATMNIVPDRITIEIGLEEYYKQKVFGDSTLVKLSDIERNVRKTLSEAGVPDSLIVVSDLGNYRNRDMSSTFLMAKRLSAVVADFNQIESISDRLDRKGIVNFNITKIDNSDMEQYNRKGLKAALDAARQKAEFIAENEGLKLIMPYEIVETTGEPSMRMAFSNVAYDSGSGMENMRRIVRRYSVKVRYLFSTKQ
ncbi:MAG: SIMPL domain-containing protein [Muribaculaceae bacterium]|nr:SIMPL domain-containing protein [Muribaculaceae bacterium]